MKSDRNTLNFESFIYKDYFKSPIIKSMMGFLISLTGLIWIYVLAQSYIGGSLLVGIFIILCTLNYFLFFYDKSIHFSPKFFRGGVKKVDLPSLQTFITEISLDPAQKTLKNPFGNTDVENSNLILFSNRSNHKVVAVMGLSLKSTALHIQSNFENFLRVIYSLKTNIPLTFQIDLKNMGVENEYTNSLYGDRVKNLKNETISRGSHSIFEYNIFITRTYRFPSKHKIHDLLYSMKQNYITVSNVLETNFAHFKFSSLYGGRLIDSIRGSITGNSYDLVQKNSVLNSVPDHRRYVLWIRPIFVVLGNMGILWFMTYKIKNEILYYVMISLSVISCIILGLNFWWSNFFDFQGFNFNEIDMCPSGEFLYHSRTKSIHFYDYYKKKIYSKVHYSMTNFNKVFRFNQVKFYRTLLKHVVSGNFSVSIQFHTRRISSMDRFKKLFSEDFWEKWTEIPNLRNSLERRNCGFYFFQPIFSIGMVRDQNVINVSESDLGNNIVTLQNTFLPLFKIGFPNCGIVSIKPNIIYQYLTKSRLYSTFNSLLNLQFSTGLSLIPFISIPEEIHKYLPINYAGEFSTPLLQDEIIFGYTFNPENNSIETAGGISFNEFKQNTIFLGESYENVQKGLTRFVAELLTHRFPCIIFDWDGTWKHLVGQLEFHNSLNNIKYITAGENFGIELFDLPYMQRGPLFISYISSIIDVFGRVFHYGDDQLALLKSGWVAADGDKAITIADISTKISGEADGIKKFYKDKTPIIADLHLLQKDYLVRTFDMPIENWISLDLILDNSSTLVINLEALKDNNMKNLFIQAFLAQYHYICEMKINENTQKIPRMIVLPALDILFNDRIEMRQNTQVNSILSNLLKQQHILVGSGTHIGEIHPTIFNLFKNRFIFRTQLEVNTRILEGFMNFDENFTNIQHIASASRKISYQTHYLSTIDPDKCIILRPYYTTPYVFQFDYANYFTSDEINRVSNSDIKTFEVTPIQVVSEEEMTQFKTSLEGDFNDSSSIIPSLYNFLKISVDKLDSLSYMTKDQITTNLNELFSGIDNGEFVFTQNYPKEIFCKLKDKGYLSEITTAGGKSFEIKGYEITQKSLTCLMEIGLIDKPEEEGEKTEDVAFEKPNEIVLPATIPPKTQDSPKIIDTEWMDNFELELSEIIVPCRIAFEKGNYEESYNRLKSGWERAMEKTKNYPHANGLNEKLKDRYQWITDTNFNHEDEMHTLINRIEYFIISM